MIELGSVNFSWLGILVGALALFVLGAVWYTALFGRIYRRELGLAEPGDGRSALPPGRALGQALTGQLIAGLIIAVVLAWFIGNSSAGRGAIVGLGAGVLVAAALLQLHQFEGRSSRHLLLHVGYMLIGLTAVGAVLGAFQAE